MKKYRVAYGLALQNVMQRRASLLMDRLGGVAILLSLYYFWSALMGGKEAFLGYSGTQMLSYILAMNVLRSFVITGRGWELIGDISSGRISSYLVRPLSYRSYSLSLDLAQKTVHVAAAFLEIGALILLFRIPLYLPQNPWAWAWFTLAACLSSLIFFYMEFLVSSLAFWTSDSGGPLFCFDLFLQFAAGGFFPLDVLPSAAQSALKATPFPYLIFLPLNIYLERISGAEVFQVVAVQAVWLAGLAWASQAVWNRGLENYAAEGG